MRGIRRVVAVLFALAAAALAGRPGQAAVILDSLLVRVYDNAGILAASRGRAIKSADEIIARAGIAVQWHDCPAGAPLIRGACAAAPSGTDLAVRLVRAPKPHSQDRALGMAYIDSATGSGTLATVFVDRVERLAADGKADRWALVGRVMAHELGHLLLGTNSHSDDGLMREIWTVRELTRNRAVDWLFSRRQRDELRTARIGGKLLPLLADSGGVAPAPSGRLAP
jgi:hypothetical protein